MPATKVLEQRIAALEQQIGQLRTSIARLPRSEARTELEETLAVLCQIHRVYVMRVEQTERQRGVMRH